MKGMQEGASMSPGGARHADHPAGSGRSKPSRPGKTPSMPGMDHGKMPGMSSAPAQSASEALAQ
ncbi:hypothetical protein ACXYUI_33935, partial [Klebsiella pneumoniae]